MLLGDQTSIENKLTFNKKVHSVICIKTYITDTEVQK